MAKINSYYQPELTLPDLLKRAATRHPDHYIGYADKNGDLRKQTYAELYKRADQVASGLFDLGLKKGDKVILTTQDGQETIEMLWGCFLMGVVPTILQPPVTFSGYNPSVVKLLKVYHQLGDPYIFVSPELKDFGELPRDKVKNPSQVAGSGEFPDPGTSPDDLTFIQFSSGSTGEPKGIMLRHRNILVNLEAIRLALELDENSRFCNWMPLYHDMGLIGYHFTPVYCSIPQCQIDTMDFIMKPGLWLSMMSHERSTISGCTNFGLALVLRYLERVKSPLELDLSGLKALLNGAEPISVKIMQDFIDSLQPYGFRPETMMSVYGMAEATLAISFASLYDETMVTAFDSTLLDREGKALKTDISDPSARVLSEVGTAINDIHIRIVDEKDRPVAEGIAGHIQVSGPSITEGYYNNPDATRATFCGEWLRTGDIGFFFEGKLYISGRFKDIIFKNGRNYFANDLEDMACTMDEVKYGKVCFGGITDKTSGQDRVIAFVASLPEDKSKDTFSRLRGLLRSNLGITLDELVLIKSNEIPKTSSGKLQRYKLMQRYANGEFEDRRITAEN